MTPDIVEFFGLPADAIRDGKQKDLVNGALNVIQEAVINLYKILPVGGTVIFRLKTSTIIVPNNGGRNGTEDYIVVTRPVNVLEGMASVKINPPSRMEGGN